MAVQYIGGFPYYQAKAQNGNGDAVAVVFEVQREGALGGVSDDDVADAVRDYLAGLSGATSSYLKRYSVTETSL